MPKGKHKGGRRHFTDFEATEEEKLKKEKEKQWRKNRGEEDSDDESGSEKSEDSDEESDCSGEEEEEEEEKQVKAKGVSGIIETQNLNREVKKTQKVGELELSSSKPQLSRKEKEEIERQRAQTHYRKLHAAGKTEEARADLERLALIKQQRAEAAKRKDEDKKAKESAANAKKEQTAKALNKKTKS